MKTGDSFDEKAALIGQTKVLLNAREKCVGLWKSIRKTDFKNEGELSPISVSTFLKAEAKSLKELLFIETVDDLLELVDIDEDGILRAEELILMFVMIKDRMESVAFQLSELQEYSLYKTLLAKVRELEKDILNYQKVLRSLAKKRATSELFKQTQIQREEFQSDWARKLEQNKGVISRNKEQLLKKHQEELEDTYQIQFCAVYPPKPRIKELEVQAKMLGVCERAEEAKEVQREQEKSHRNDLLLAKSRFEQQKKNQIKDLLIRQNKKVRHFNTQSTTKVNSLQKQYETEQNYLEKSMIVQQRKLGIHQNLHSKNFFSTFHEEARRKRLQSKQLARCRYPQTKSVLSLERTGLIKDCSTQKSVRRLQRIRIQSRPECGNAGTSPLKRPHPRKRECHSLCQLYTTALELIEL